MTQKNEENMMKTRLIGIAALAALVMVVGCGKSDKEVILSIVKDMIDIPGKNFKMGKYEVTQEQWQAVMGENPSGFKGDLKPVENVSWNDCKMFLEKLNSMPEVKASGLTFRLPTEKEWEYACRAGSTGDYCKLADGTEITSDTLGEVAWYRDNSDIKTHPVGQKKPNAFGLYDMHGNVWEWCEDLFLAGYSDRVRRGGGWGSLSRFCPAGNRHSYDPDYRVHFLGFRLAASQHCDFKTGSQSPPHSCSATPTKDGHAIPVSRASRRLGWVWALVKGAATLDGEWKAVEGASAAEKAAMRFFKVVVEAP